MSNHRKSLKKELMKCLDISDQYIKEAGRNTRKLGKMMTDAAHSGLQFCAEKITDTLQPMVERLSGAAESSDAAQSEQDPVRTGREQLTRELDRAVRRTYYAEGGYRFFAQHLVEYANKSLDRVVSVEEAWIGGYNSNIQPMLTRMQKLERAMADLRSEYGREPLPLENEELLEQMRAFTARVKEERLDRDTGWERSAYIQAMRLYAQDLNEQLLKPYPFPEE